MSDMDRELDRLLSGMRDELLPEGVLETTRTGVRAQIAAAKRRRRTWTWLSMAAAAAALWFVGIAVRERPLARLPVIAQRTPAVPEAEFRRGISARAQRAASGPKQQREAPPVLQAGSRSAGSRQLAEKALVAGKGRAIAGGGTAPKVRPSEDGKTADTEFIHIVTDDPNVVILWALNSKGETR